MKKQNGYVQLYFQTRPSFAKAIGGYLEFLPEEFFACSFELGNQPPGRTIGIAKITREEIIRLIN